MKVELGEIVFCNLTIKYNNKNHTLKDVVYKNNGNLFFNKRILLNLKIKEPVEVISIDIIKRMGFEKKSNGFTEVKKNNEKRNKITGAYE